jgi:hypothetical protein
VALEIGVLPDRDQRGDRDERERRGDLSEAEVDRALITRVAADLG